MSAPYYQKIDYSDRLPKYKDWNQYEWDLKNTFSYDDYFGFSDLRIFKIQNSHRIHYMWDDFGISRDSASLCNAFNTNRGRHRHIQRHLCSNRCFWDPQECFLEDFHSGNLQDLMHKDFHDQFNPDFLKQFDRSFTDKIDWAPTGGLGHFPSIGLNRLIDELGITTKLEYNDENYAINFDNLNREFWNSIPDRPLYVLEEKKCHDIIEALINVNRDNIVNKKMEMQKKFDQSYKGNGPVHQKPILSMMMWGPLADLNVVKTDEHCKFDSFVDRQAGTHVCSNFSEKNYWMYTHGDKVDCIKGPNDILEGPVMTPDLSVVYPCNRSGCNHDCICDLCINSHMCPKSDHKKHLRSTHTECIVVQNFQCQDHKINHPDNFDEKEDISIQKNIFYHNLELQQQPRQNSTGEIKFSGIKKSCSLCRDNVKNHLKYHHVIHLNCKFCVHQMKTAVDKTFWDKVCNICGKTFPTIKSLKYWHKRTHSSDWKCHECDVDFNRKWTLKRHLIEIHGIKKEDFLNELDEYDDDSSANDSETTRSHTDMESDTDYESQFKCDYCDKTFEVQRYLNAHIKANHTNVQIFKCESCDQTFTFRQNLQRHEETVHNKSENIVCNICGSQFTRIDNLNEHIKCVHMQDIEKFTCPFCGQKFTRKFNMTRHEQTCTSNPDK